MALLHSAPLLTWKGIQQWSVGSRAPGLCRLFLKTNAPPRFRLAKFVKRRGERKCSTALIQLAENGIKRQPRPSSALGSCLSTCAKGTPDGVRHGNAKSISAYERMKAGDAAPNPMKVVKLGSQTAAQNQPHLQRQGSAQSSDSQAESSSSSTKLMGSPSVLSSKLKGTCARIMTAAQNNSPCISELFAGNQFLVHVTAAPVAGGASSGGKADLNPSAGLVNASQHQRDSDFRDRIVFFQ